MNDVKEHLKLIENDYNYKFIEIFKLDYFNEIYSYLGFSKYVLITFFIIKILLILSILYLSFRKLVLKSYKFSDENYDELTKERNVLDKKINEIPDEDYFLLNGNVSLSRKKLIKRRNKIDKQLTKIRKALNYDDISFPICLGIAAVAYIGLSFITLAIFYETKNSNMYDVLYDGLKNIEFTEHKLERIEKLSDTEFLLIRDKNGKRINEIYTGNIVIDDKLDNPLLVYKDYPNKEFYSDVSAKRFLSSDSARYDSLMEVFKEGEIDKELRISSKTLVELSGEK